MNHSFDVEVATKYGVNAAIILDNIFFWCQKNEANQKNEHDGLYWTYNSVKAFCELFPYISEKQIRGALETLEQEGLIQSNNFNINAYDRTKWFAITQKGKSIYLKGQMDLSKRANGFIQKGEPIPDIKPDIKPDINKEREEEPSPYKKPETKEPEPAQRFSKPSHEEVKAYCDERKNAIDPQRFIDYYESTGWMIGTHKMKDWRAAVRTWERNEKPSQPSSPSPRFNAPDWTKKLAGVE